MTGLVNPLIQILADGRFHSGTELGETLNVSRAAVWKAIQRIAALGVEVHSVRGKGYRLPAPVQLLDASAIRAGLGEEAESAIGHMAILEAVDSTNSLAMRHLQEGSLVPAEGKYSVFLAEQQTSGKGRRGRTWVSPYGHNIYLTMVRQVDTTAMGTEGISLVVGLALVRALREEGLEGMGVKWPNDIVHNGSKLAGILLEITGDLAGVCQLVIGAGINVRTPQAVMHGVDQPWTDLHRIKGEAPDRNRLASRIVFHIMAALQEFEARGLGAFNREWQSHDALRDRPVELITPGGSQFGTARGITGTGALILETAQGLQVVNGGEISLRRAT